MQFMMFVLFMTLVSVKSVTNKKGKGKGNARVKGQGSSQNCHKPTEEELLPLLAGIAVSIESADDCGVAAGICSKVFEAANNCLTISDDDNCFCQLVASNEVAAMNEEDCIDVLEALPELLQNPDDRRQLFQNLDDQIPMKYWLWLWKKIIFSDWNLVKP